MVKTVFAILLLAYLIYSPSVYFYSAKSHQKPDVKAKKGFTIWQEKNCQACHQLYGLGGYMGPDLTNIISNPGKGEAYAATFIKNGTLKMPNLQLSDEEVSDLVSFLKWVDKSGKSFVAADSVTWYGNYKLNKD
jgi:nitric oxide reductase subunit C